jgi:hypothetical protein
MYLHIKFDNTAWMVSHISRLILGIVRFSRGNKIQMIPFTEKNNEVKLIGISVNLLGIY